MMRSLRGRLTAGVVLGTAVVVIAGGSILYRAMSERLWSAFDEALLARARLLASLVEWDEGAIEFELDDRVVPEFSRKEEPEYFEIWAGVDSTGEALADGRLQGDPIVRSPSLGDAVLEIPGKSAGAAAAIVPLRLPDGRHGRAALLDTVVREDSVLRQRDPAQGPGVPRITVLVASGTGELERKLGELRALLLTIGGIVTLLTAGVLVVIVHAGLKPLRRLAGQISKLPPDVTGRITLPNAPRELAGVVEVTNRLLERLESTLERERSFTADAAHELRTPLGGFRAILEVTLARARESRDYEQAMRECLEITGQMQTTTERLLSLARLDQRQVSAAHARLLLDALLREAWRPFAPLAAGKKVQVIWQSDPELTIESDRVMLQQMFSNMFQNAAEYVNVEGEIQLHVSADPGSIDIRLANTGSQVRSEDAERVFDRFWRADPSRQTAGLHAGLGLALVKRYATLLGGEVAAVSVPGGRFTITLRFPAR